jgi:hypothetical protein
VCLAPRDTWSLNSRHCSLASRYKRSRFSARNLTGAGNRLFEACPEFLPARPGCQGGAGAPDGLRAGCDQAEGKDWTVSADSTAGLLTEDEVEAARRRLRQLGYL